MPLFVILTDLSLAQQLGATKGVVTELEKCCNEQQKEVCEK